MVARQPLPGLTCHLPEVPGSHNPTGREAWTSEVWRVEYPRVRELGERGKDGKRHTWRHTDGPKAAKGLERVKRENGGKIKTEKGKLRRKKYEETQKRRKGKPGRIIRAQKVGKKTGNWGKKWRETEEFQGDKERTRRQKEARDRKVGNTEVDKGQAEEKRHKRQDRQEDRE